MFNELISKGLRSTSPEIRRKSLRLTVITIIANDDLPMSERLDRIEKAFEIAGWRRPGGCHDVDEFYKP